MENLVLRNEKEKLFLEKLILSTDIYEYPKAKNGKEFLNLMTLRNHERSWVLSELTREVEDNLLLLVYKDSRVAYLQRLIQKIDIIKSIQIDSIESLEYDKNDKFEFNFYDRKESSVYFAVSRKGIIHNRKAGIMYLNAFEVFIQIQLKIELPEQYKERAQLQDIFKEGKFQYCLEIMKDIEIIDKNKKNILTPKKGYKLFALIDGINTVSSDKNILVRNFTSDELVTLFNSYLGTSYTKHNRPTKKEREERNGKGYFQTLKEIKELMKK